MREILFRGKRVDNGEWVYGSLVNNLWGKGDEKVCEIVTTDVDYYDCWEDLIFGAIVEVIPETVGQLTGLLDKNSDRIFEGDLLFCMGINLEVYFDINEGSWMVKAKNLLHYLSEINEDLELNGNINEK